MVPPTGQSPPRAPPCTGLPAWEPAPVLCLHPPFTVFPCVGMGGGVSGSPCAMHGSVAWVQVLCGTRGRAAILLLFSFPPPTATLSVDRSLCPRLLLTLPFPSSRIALAGRSREACTSYQDSGEDRQHRQRDPGVWPWCAAWWVCGHLSPQPHCLPMAPVHPACALRPPGDCGTTASTRLWLVPTISMPGPC